MMASPARERRIRPHSQPVGELPVDLCFYQRQIRQQCLAVDPFLRRLLPMRYCSWEPRGPTRELWMARRSKSADPARLARSPPCASRERGAQLGPAPPDGSRCGPGLKTWRASASTHSSTPGCRGRGMAACQRMCHYEGPALGAPAWTRNILIHEQPSFGLMAPSGRGATAASPPSQRTVPTSPADRARGGSGGGRGEVGDQQAGLPPCS